MSDKEPFICPFCGGPYTTLIPAGAVQVKCKYCKAAILIPPRLGGIVQRCPNHPDMLAVGLCNDCGKKYCDHCLYVLNFEPGKLYVCPECHRKKMNERAYAILGLGVMFGGLIIVFLFFVASFGLLDLGVGPIILMGGIFLALLLVLVAQQRMYKPKTVHDLRQTQNN